MGRPSKFQEEMVEQVEKLARLGATLEEIASFFKVAVSTVSKWLVENEAFSEALKNGRISADAEMADALYKNGLAGNVTAQIFWLKNRRSDQWRDKRDVDITHKRDPQFMSDDELASIAATGGANAPEPQEDTPVVH